MFSYKGKIIELKRKNGRRFKPTGLRQRAMDKLIFEDAVKIKAVTIWVATGSVEQACELAEIPISTFRKWKREPWFQLIVDEVQVERNGALDTAFSDACKLAMEQLMDRLKNGDSYVNTKGIVVRRPVAARDLAIIAAVNIDKRKIIRDAARREEEKEELPKQVESKIVDKLEELRKTFEDLAGKGNRKTAEIKAIK